MTVLAIVPAKPFSEGKSRLRDCFRVEELVQINRACFVRTLTTLKKCPDVGRILVVSRGQEVLDLAHSLNVSCLAETGQHTLNSSLTQALNFVWEQGTKKILIIPTDLPRLTPEDLHGLFALGQGKTGVSLVPDHYQTGTNAVYLNAVGGFKPQFGRNSFQKHTRQALQLTSHLNIKLIKNIQHDLDTYTDLQMLDRNLLDQLQNKNGKDERND